VYTYREGVAALVGHDLVIDVTDWQAQVVVADDGTLVSVELGASPASLVVLEGKNGVRPLTDGDRLEIRRLINDKVFAGRPIGFRSSAIATGSEGALKVEGDLTLGVGTRPTAFSLTSGADGRVQCQTTLRQSEWGIKPYRGLMGALKVRDMVEVAIDAQLPAG
jgi:polyisoprenoid-binding protein YceI